MEKKGQIVVFIIVGVLLLIGVAVFFALKSSGIEYVETEGIQEDVLKGNAVKNHIEKCLKKTTEEAIFENSYYGGYFTLPEYSTEDLFYNVPYYIKLEQSFVPTDDLLAAEIGKYVDTMLDFCLDFGPFENQGYVIEVRKPQSKVKLSQTKVIVSTIIPTSITIGTSRKEGSLFEIEVPAEDFYRNIQLTRGIVELQGGKEICLDCLSEYTNKDVFVAVIPYYDNTYIFEIKDSSYKIFEDDYCLRFALQYEMEE